MMHLHHKVSALIDGELRGGARRRALAHLRHCAACRHELHATAALKRRLLGMPSAEPSADLFSSLDSVTAPGGAESGSVASTRSAGGVLRLLVGAGSLSMAAFSLAYVVGAPPTTAVADVTPPVDEAGADFLGAAATHPLADPAVDGLLGAAGGHTALPADPNEAKRGSGLAAVAVPLAPPPGDDPRAVDLLDRAASAPDRVSYRATREVEGTTLDDGGLRVKVAIDHVPEQGTVYRLVDGRRGGPAVFVDRGGAALGEGLGDDTVDLLSEAYDLDVIADQEFLGRPATVIGVGRDGVLVAELWIDRATGLILKRDLYENGRLVRSSETTGLQIVPDAFLLHLPPELDTPPTSAMPTSTAASWNDEGWTCPGSMSGGDFSLTGLGHVDVSGDAVFAHYSDGLSNVSLFEQRGSLADTALGGFEQTSVEGAQVLVQYGLSTVAVWASDDTVYTLVTDAPPEQADALVSALPHTETADDGVWSRVGRGFSELAGAVAP
jgi:sigma-E factor negative regulatory protein RseB